MKTFISLLLYGAGIAVGCSCVIICLWGLIQFLFDLPQSGSSIILAVGR